MPEKQTALAAYADRFSALRDTLPGADLPWLQSLRDTGLQRFLAAGFPATGEESWRFTNLRSLAAAAITPLGDIGVQGADLAELVPGSVDAVCSARLVFVNGVAVPELWSDGEIPGVTIERLQSALHRDPAWCAAHLGSLLSAAGDRFAALNTALMQDGFVLRVARNVAAKGPIHVVSIGVSDAPLSFHPRGLIVVEDGAEAVVVESHVGAEARLYFSNPAVEIIVGANAKLGHYRLQNEGRAAFHVARLAVTVERDGYYDGFSFATGGHLSRYEAGLTLAGPGADLAINGAYLLDGEQHGDLTTVIDHAAPRTTSRESVKGVLAGTAHGVFQGQIKVRKNSQKIEGYQMNRALLLSRGATVNAKPELEIFADDVKCSHGATVGELDPAQLFYLRARGVPEPLARQMLVEAFVGEAIEAIGHPGVRDAFSAHAATWMAARVAGSDHVETRKD